MIETDKQRRWWFANHPDYSHGGSRGDGTHHSRDSREPEEISPRDVVAYADKTLENVSDPVIVAILKSLKRHAEEMLQPTAAFAAEGEAQENTSDKPDNPFTYERGIEDGQKWALDPNRGPGPPRVLNPDYLDGFSEGVTAVWEQAKRVSDNWKNLPESLRTAFEFLIGAGTASRTLGRNLEEAGSPRPEGHDAHHIVANDDPRSLEARRVLENWDIDINGAHNGVWLPGKPGIGQGVYHRWLHTDKYYDTVNELLRGSKNRMDALRILREIAEQLSIKKFPY